MAETACACANNVQSRTNHTPGQEPFSLEEESLRRRIKAFGSNDVIELGAKHGPDGMSLHFVSSSPDLFIGYATRDKCWSSTELQVDGRSHLSIDFPDRYKVTVTKVDGKYEYKIDFDPGVEAAKIKIGGRGYFVTRNQIDRARDVEQAVEPELAPDPEDEPTQEADAATDTENREAEVSQDSDFDDLVLPPSDPVNVPPTNLTGAGSTGDTAAPETEAARLFRRAAESTTFGEDVSDQSSVGEINDLSEISRSAAGILSQRQLAELANTYIGETIETGSREASALYRQTLNAINQAASQISSIGPAPEELTEKLGIPEGAQVLLARSGAGLAMLPTEYLTEPIDRAFGSSIRIKDLLGKAAIDISPDDVVVIQAYNEGKGGATFLRLSVVDGNSSSPSDWRVRTHEASYREQPEARTDYRVRHNPNEIVTSFNQWRTEHAPWFPEQAEGIVEQALGKKVETLAAIAQEAEEQRKQEEARAREAERQKTIFARVNGSTYRMGTDNGYLTEVFGSSAAWRAAEERTGTFTTKPSAGIEFHIHTEGREGSEVVRLDSYEQVKKLPAAQRALIERALTTPYQGTERDAVQRLVLLFPNQTYRPGWVASNFYSQRSYAREFIDTLTPAYDRASSPAAQREFLGQLQKFLASEGGVKEDSLSRLPRSLR